MTRFLMIAAAAALTALSTPALADDEDRHCRLQPGQTVLSKDQIRQRLEAEGHKVQRLKMDDGCYEVYLSDAKGTRLEAYVHPATAAIIRLERDD